MRFKFILLAFSPIFLHAIPGYHVPWGRDADLGRSSSQLTQEAKPGRSFAVRVAEQIILFHQNVISPVDGPRSHFRPSSSSYMMQSMQKHGFVMGFCMGCDRLMRENSDPWVYRTIETEGKIFKYDPIR
jgi:putative component of membrane protein insertase Oxa1/YidC/SpoIIIJ protein YidD